MGSTNDFEDRLIRHNAGYENYTSKGLPWVLVYKIECANRSEAYTLEMKIKKRGIKRYLLDNNILLPV